MKRVDNTSILEEIFNAITHGVGALMSIVGLIILLHLAQKDGSMLKNIAFSIFGASVIIAYLSSTLYHSLRFTRARKIFKIFDFSSIFLLIAGTYTPFVLLALKGQHGMVLLLLIWLMAISGIVLKTFFDHKLDKLFLGMYLLMGWLIVFEAKSLLAALPLEPVLLLGAGGLFYTSGVAFFLLKRIPFNHMVWHIFVICGSTLHFLALFYL
jgi:hemolysin III